MLKVKDLVKQTGFSGRYWYRKFKDPACDLVYYKIDGEYRVREEDFDDYMKKFRVVNTEKHKK